MRKYAFILLLLLLGIPARSQNNFEELPYYYPDQAPWPLEFSVDVHVMQCTKENPRNFVPADTPRIHHFFDLVNQMYNTLDTSVGLKVPDIPFFHESMIRFRLRKVHFHVDSTGWNAQWVEPTALAKILKYDAATHTFAVTGKGYRNYKRLEGVFLEYKNKKGLTLTYDTSFMRDNISYVRVKEKVDTAGMSRLGYNMKRDDNCHDTNYKLYGADNPYSIHVFFTESSASEIGFGCGPSKDYMNLANAWRGGDWVNAQMLSHELGHCLGLSHTDYPQFPDLPKHDKFGWLPCDRVETSNNIMGYNICRSYLSPMQIAYVHQQFNLRWDYVRLTLNRFYNPEHVYEISYKTELERNLVVNGDIVVHRNKKLVIKKILTVHEQSKIVLEDGAQIIVDGGAIVVMNNKQNSNIVYCRKLGSSKPPKKKGQIKTLNNGKITGLQIP